jgi:hypothetical protein
MKRYEVRYKKNGGKRTLVTRFNNQQDALREEHGLKQSPDVYTEVELYEITEVLLSSSYTLERQPHNEQR